MRSIHYRPEIDGLRALAVLPVILFHLGVAFVPGGFVGVDVFFVISGFLITAIITKEQQQDKFTFAAFWTRRAKRILPVLLTVIFTTLVANHFIGYRNVYSSQGLQALSALFSVSNVYMWQIAGDYWGPTAETLPFLHCWSLSVEEQFYIFYPVLLFWLLQKKRQLLLPVMTSLLVCSLLFFVALYTRKPSAAFYLLPSRAWELGAGCLLALLGPQLTGHLARGYSHVLSALGVVLILASYVLLPSESVGLKLLLPVVGAVFLVGFGQSAKGVGRLLSIPAVVYIGNISYSLYVWHWPVIVLARQKYPSITESLPGVALLLALIFFLSILSYHFIESPLRRSPLTLRLLPVGAVACLLAVGAVQATANNRGNAYDTSAFSQVSYSLFKYDIKPETPLPPLEQKLLYGVNLSEKLPGQENAFARDGIIRRYGKETPDILVLGDSHAIMWAPIIEDVCREKKLTASFFVKVALSPFVELPLGALPNGLSGFTPQQRRQFDTRRLECIKRWKPLVILSTRWKDYEDIEKMRDLIEYIGRCGSQVILVEQPPELKWGNQNSAQYLSYLGYSPSATGQRQTFPQGEQKAVTKGRALLSQLAQKYPFCRVLKTYDYYAPDANDAYVIDGRDILYMDDDHLSINGASLIRPRFAQAISEGLSMRRNR